MKRRVIGTVIFSLAVASIIYVGGCGGKGLNSVLAPTDNSAGAVTAFVNPDPSNLTTNTDAQIGTADAVDPTTFSGGATIATSGATFLDMTTCRACHRSTYDSFIQTNHGTAWTRKVATFNASAAKYCIQCHTVTAPFYDLNANHKFEPALGETAPFGLSPTQTANTWGGTLGSATFTQASNVPAEFQGIQCENCHGPASLHNGDINFIVKGTQAASARTCDPCHDQNYEWAKMAHSVSMESDTPTGTLTTSAVCATCHSQEGFNDFVDYSGTTLNADIVTYSNTLATKKRSNGTAVHNIDCVACHDPHKVSNPSQLRIAAETLCITCHQGRKKVPGESNAPHHNLQGRILNGQGIVNTDGKMLWSSAELICKSKESSATADVTATCGTSAFIYTVATSFNPTMGSTTCVNCHMYQNGTYRPKLLGHTFMPRTEACQGCHSGMDAATVIGRKAADFTAKWNALNARLANATAASAGFTAAQKTLYNNAQWNINYLDFDGSKGFHNTPLANQAFVWTDQMLTQLGY